MDEPRLVVHADMDAFYAAVEQLDDPDLRGKPILVGPKSKRGVVLTASYEARPFGVGSAMAMAVAVRRCPQAVVVPPRFERYQEVSRIVMGVFEDFSPTVEAISLDEAFLDMTGAEGVFGPPEAMGRAIKEAVREATGGLTVSVGISGTKYVAKVASDFEKPDGLTIVPQRSAREFLAPLPVRKLWGAGPKTAARLEALGYRLISDLQNAEPARLERELGSMGLRFKDLSEARDPRRVSGSRSMKSIGCERTLSDDISDPEQIRLWLRRSADRIATRVRKRGARARGVRVKLKTASFSLLTRQMLLPQASDLADHFYAAGSRLLDRFEHNEPYRLVGMAVYDLVTEGPEQLGLFDKPPPTAELEQAVDALHERFGHGTVMRGEDLAGYGARGPSPNLDFLADDDEADDPHWTPDP